MPYLASDNKNSYTKTNKMKNTIKKLQREVNQICKSSFIDGEVFMTVDIKCDNYGELESLSENLINSIEAPIGFNKCENQIYNKSKTIIIGTQKI